MGFEFPRDEARVLRMARLLEQFGQPRILSLSESAERNSTSIIGEAFDQDLYNEQIAEVAAGIPLPAPTDVQEPF